MLRCCWKTVNRKEEIFSIWAPAHSPWSRWAKPVLFAYIDSPAALLPVSETAPDVSWAPVPSVKVALVLDLPGVEGVLAGVALAAHGYRPVPLYNAVPTPSSEGITEALTGRTVAAVNVLPILAALRHGAGQLAYLHLPSDAPPAFLLDINRSAEGREILPEDFDNRSISFTTDFPSANFFASQGVERVILVLKGGIRPQTDLAHSLYRWQDAGFKLEVKQIDQPGGAQPLQVARPSWYRAMFQRALASFGFRRSGTGGFGAWVYATSSGG